jgi:hypothetical protein
MKSRTKNPKILSVLILALSAVMIALLAVAIVKANTKKDRSVIGIVYDGQTLKDGDTIGYLDQNATFEVQGADDYTITIKARYVEDRDFSFSYLSEPYTWKDMNGRDMTNGFNVERTSDNVIISYPSIAEILSNYLGDTVTMKDGVNADFSMIFNHGNDTTTIYFTLFIGEFGLSETSIIF